MSRVSKLVSQAVSSTGQTFVQPKLFIPVDCQVPETSKEIMARTMLASGLITKDEYEKMLGVAYDIDVQKDSDEDYFDDDAPFDEFSMSYFAGYEDDYEGDPAPDPTPALKPVEEPLNEPKTQEPKSDPEPNPS